MDATDWTEVLDTSNFLSPISVLDLESRKASISTCFLKGSSYGSSPKPRAPTSPFTMVSCWVEPTTLTLNSGAIIKGEFERTSLCAANLIPSNIAWGVGRPLLAFFFLLTARCCCALGMVDNELGAPSMTTRIKIKRGGKIIFSARSSYSTTEREEG